MADKNRERGLRAALNNPRVSEEAKQHDRELLASEFGENIAENPPQTQAQRRASTSKKGTGTHASPEEGQSGPAHTAQTTGRKARRASSGDARTSLPQMTEEKDKANVIRGLRSALKNPHVSEKAKEADRKKLMELGETVE